LVLRCGNENIEKQLKDEAHPVYAKDKDGEKLGDKLIVEIGDF